MVQFFAMEMPFLTCLFALKVTFYEVSEAILRVGVRLDAQAWRCGERLSGYRRRRLRGGLAEVKLKWFGRDGYNREWISIGGLQLEIQETP
jgi:hypothetical protein